MIEIKKSQGKAVQVTVKSKEKNSSGFCLDFVDFVHAFGLWVNIRMVFLAKPYKTEFVVIYF